MRLCKLLLFSRVLFVVCVCFWVCVFVLIVFCFVWGRFTCCVSRCCLVVWSCVCLFLDVGLCAYSLLLFVMLFLFFVFSLFVLLRCVVCSLVCLLCIMYSCFVLPCCLGCFIVLGGLGVLCFADGVLFLFVSWVLVCV